MTRLAGGRDGDRRDHAGGLHRSRHRAGRALGAARARGERRGRAARRARRDAVLRPRAGAGRRAQGAARPGPDDRDLREPEGSVRDPRHPAEQGHRVGPALAPAHRLARSARTTGRGCARSATTTRSGSSRRPGSSPAATPGATSMASTTRRRTSRSRASRTCRCASPRTTSASSTATSVNTFRLQRGVRPWGARTASSDPEWRYISVRRLFIMLRRSLEAGFAWITFEPNNHADLGSRAGPNRRIPLGSPQQGDAGRRESRAGVLRKMRC